MLIFRGDYPLVNYHSWLEYPRFLIGNTSSIRVHFPANYVKLPECLNYTAVDPKQLHKITYEILETNPEHGHGIPANMGGKLGDKTGDKRKTKPGRRTRHPGQRGRQDRKQEKAKTREADTASQPRQTHLTQH